MSAAQHNSPSNPELLADSKERTRSEAHLRDFVETASIGLHLVGPDGVILWANQAELELLGYTREEYIGHPIAEFHLDEAVIDDILTRLRTGEKLSEYEARLRAKDGSVRYVSINSSVLFEDGRFLHTRCFTRDITARKLTEEALRDSEARLLQANTQLAQRMDELKKRNLEIQDSRRAALNMMEDAVQSRQAIEKLNEERTRAEEALRESHERVSNIVESITDAFITLDKEWRFVYLNERAAEITRLLHQSPASLPGKNIWNEFPDWLGTSVERNFRGAIKEQVTTEFEFLFPSLHSWFEIRAYPSKDGLSVYLQNITARKRAETALAAEKKVLELIATGTPLPEVLETLMHETEAQSTDGMLSAILLVDETGKKLLHGAAPSLPATYNEAINGLPIGADVGSCGAAAFERRQVCVFDISSDPLWTDFRELAMSHGLGACCSTPILSSHGEVLGTVAMYYARPHDPGTQDREVIAGTARLASIVIERSRAREALRKSEARLRFMAESMPQKIFTAKANGDMDYFNQQWISFTGLSFEQLKDSGWTQFIHPDDLEENLRVWKQSINTGEDFQMEHRCRRADGVYRWHLSRAHAMQDESGDVLMWIGSNTDIDDVKQTEAELQSLIVREQTATAEAQAANRVKDEFLAMVSHELRTPLNAIAGWARLLRSGNLKETDVDRAVETIDRNADAQATIINELLDVSRIISGKLQIEQQPVNLIDVIHAAAEVTRPAAEAKGIEIILRLDGAAGPVIGDAVRLQQVVWNLLSNAIKFTPKEGLVEVELGRQGTDIAIVVSDSGQGIDAAFLPHVFERFKQADSSEKRIHGGLGLGLSIVRHLVEMHGGAISAESEGQGLGSTFTINLPIMPLKPLKTILGSAADGQVSRTQSVRDAYAATKASSDSLKGVRVLVIDDQADARELFTFALERYSAEVRVCSSAREAFAEFLLWKPDVIVSDIGLPGEDGYELMEKIRALEDNQGGRTPALALTGYASAVDRAKALAAGYQTHLTKPVGFEELAGAVAELSGRKYASRRVEVSNSEDVR